MAYLPSTEIVLDAILTKKGKELLAQGKFDPTQVAFGDDEIDYTLYNPTHPSGSAYYGDAIRRTPIGEAIPDENQSMNSRLVTLPRGTSRIPVISVGIQSIVLKQGAPITINPQTLNLGTTGSISGVESSGYAITVADSRLLGTFKGVGLLDVPVIDSPVPATGSQLSHTEVGITFTLTASTASTLFTGSATTISTTITISGRESGAKITIPLTVQKI